MSAYGHPELVGIDEVEDILDAYAQARLTPTGPILSRMRAAVMLEADAALAARAAERRHVAQVATAATAAGQPAPRRFAFPRFTLAHLARPAFALGFAGILSLGIGATVTAAPPGSPFYGARVALEQAFLPTQIDARLASHEQHLDERLVEAEAAAARGDAAGLAAALTAFQTEIDATIADAGDDFTRLAHFEAVLEKHIAKLTELSQRLPTEVARQNAVNHAIQASEKAVTKVKEKKEKSNNKPATPPGQNQNPQNPNHPNPQNPNKPDKPNKPDVPGRANRP